MWLLGAQSNELTRGITELVQLFLLKGEFTYVSARALIYIILIFMVRLYRSPIPVGGGGILIIQMITTCLRYAQRKGGGQHPVIGEVVAHLKHILVKQRTSWLIRSFHVVANVADMDPVLVRSGTFLDSSSPVISKKSFWIRKKQFGCRFGYSLFDKKTGRLIISTINLGKPGCSPYFFLAC